MITKILFATMMLFSAFCQAQPLQVPSVWAFNISNIQGSYYRALLEQANQNQNQYKFIPEHRPGAGGAVAAGHVRNADRIVLLGTAAAYFVRPFLYSNPGYDFENFKPVYVMAYSPAALTSKNKDLATILSQDKISIGTAGPGSGTHLYALKFQAKHPDKNIIVVPYKSSTEAVQDVLGGHIDLAYEFLGDAEAKGVRILGLTGTQKVKSYTLMKDLGYSDHVDLVGIYHILVKKDVPDNVVTELRNIFSEAANSARYQELFKSDYSFRPALKTDKDYDTWYKNTINSYRALITKDMKLD